MKFTESSLHLVLCWSLVAFAVATVVVAVQKAQLAADLKDALDKLDYLESQLQGEVKPRRFIRALLTPQIPPQDSYDDTTINYRLPSSVVPTNYDLYLHPNIENGNFYGEERITVTVLEATQKIVLHAHKLSIVVITVSTDDGVSIEVTDSYLDATTEFLVINLGQEVNKDTVLYLDIFFEGEMLNKIVGLYSSSYLNENNERKTIATSKFEPTYARQAFPCFDEPAFKATFKVALAHPNTGYHALSNMNEEVTIVGEENTEVRFERSVPMSTYLACFIVSDFVFRSTPVNTNGLGENFDIRIFATSHQLHKVDFALNTAVAVTEFYIQYFQVEYPLPKLDMAAIPDFVSNAMEHWGLVTYRETALLYDRSYSSTWNKQRIAAVVAHELAHMWFGNLVTMNWWNDLWLNEGFARYMEYKGVNVVYPEWGMTDQFLVHALHSVLKYDSSVASHPIIQTVETPDQITEIFDTISYEKGASVIRMLEDAIGSDLFASAVSNYLTKYKYQNAITDDFITEVATLVDDFDVKLMMRTWTEQMGFPIVEVTRSSPTQYTLKQKRFLSNIEDYGTVYDDSPFQYTWTIPITYFTDEEANVQRAFFPYTENQITLTVPSTTKWIKLNSQQVGYYRVNYEVEAWQEIVAQLLEDHETFVISDRGHLLDDVFAIADASQLDYTIALDATKYLLKEVEFVPWYVATTKLQELQKQLLFTETIVDYMGYARNLIENIYNSVGWEVEEDNHLKNRMRVSILTAACALGLPDCLNQATNLFVRYLENPQENLPDPDLREIVYYYGMQKVGNQKEWEQMWQIFKDEQDSSEKLKLMYGLSGVKVPWLLRRFIDLAEDEDNVRRQDYFTCIQNIAANPVGTPIVWEYVREYWPALVERFGLNERYLGRMIPSITATFASDVKLEEMNDFFGKYPEAGAGAAARKQAIETVKYNIKWHAENRENVAGWLKDNTPGLQKMTTTFL